MLRSVNQNTNNPTGRPYDQPVSNWLAAERLDRYPTRSVVARPNEHPGARFTPAILVQASIGQRSALSAVRFAPDPRSQHDVPERLFLINFNPILTPLPIETKSTRLVDVLYPISKYLPFTIIRASIKRRSLYHRLKQNGIMIKLPAIHIIL